ncbi:S24 family peptidase [Shinella sp. BE166]|uniref:S24 family peptidase n=1 Tax=Shinella sp. BE166 TaxID=3373918 RepID=UPI003EBE800C
MTDSVVHYLPNAKIRDRLPSVDGPKIPVYGQAVGGVNGEFIMNGSVLFEIMAPPSVSGVKGAYAVQITGDSMSPRYEDGEIAIVDPTRRVKRGDYVIVQVQMEEEGPLLGFVKKFISHNAEKLTLEQFNPAQQLTFPHQAVVSVHYIGLAGPDF